MAKISGARRRHNAKSPEAFREMHEAHIRKLADAYQIDRAKPFVVRDRLVARVDGGEWLGDCPCGSGVAVEPGWPKARCFGCGAVFVHVEMPDEDLRLNVEHILGARRYAKNRWWKPRERLLDLALENAAHGVRF